MIPLFISYKNIHGEIRLDPSDSVRHIKDRLYRICGINPHYQSLSLLDASNPSKIKAERLLDDYNLSDYQISSYDTIKINSTQDLGNDEKFIDYFGNLNVPKYEISMEEYIKRPDNALKWKSKLEIQKNHAQTTFNKKLDPTPLELLNNNTDITTNGHSKDFFHDHDVETLLKNIHLGDRVMIQSKFMNDMKKGYVKFIGPVHFAPKVWIGVEYDDPIGKNDGSIDNIIYFDARQGHGAFVKPENVHVILPVGDPKSMKDFLEDELEAI